MRSAYVNRLKILVEEALGVLAHLTERGIIPLLRPPRPLFGKNAFSPVTGSRSYNQPLIQARRTKCQRPVDRQAG